jgi:sulfoxide reductase heme-binding subunit YedZ
VTTRDPLDYGWWLASRSAGIVAYLLLSLAVVMGLAMALRLGGPRVRVGLRVVHERIALLALGAVAAHGLFLLGDQWLKPGVLGVLVPFTMGYRPFWTGIGVVAGYLVAVLSLTYYLRRRIGARRWRLAHRFIPIAWALAAVHVIGAGTDAVSLWLDIPASR